MANLLNFKFGLHDNLASQSLSAGTVYVTTDEQALYLDLPESSAADAAVKRIRIGDIIVQDSARTAEPPFAEGAFYYFVQENAMLRWDGSSWTQVNAETDLTALQTAINNEVKRSTQKDTAHDEAIAALQEAVNARVTTAVFTEFQTSNTAAIADAKKAGTDAQATADTAKSNAATAQQTANAAKATAEAALPKAGGDMSGAIKMSGYKITSLGAPEADTDAANKLYVDNAKSEALEAAANANTAAGTAKSAADKAQQTANSAVTAAGNAQTKADQAYALAGEKTTMAEVEAKNYATQSEAQAMADAVLGDDQDKATDVTVYGAHAAAAAAKDLANTALNTANSKVTMDQVEAKNYATKTEAQNMANAVLGTDADGTNSKTVYGAHAAAAEALEKANQGIADASAAATAASGAQTTANNAAAAAKTADEKAVAAQNAADAAQDAAEAANTNADSRVLKTDFEDFEETNTAAIAEAKQAGINAGTAANAAAQAAAAADTKAQQGIADAATAKGVADAALPKAGGTMSGAIAMGNNAITGLKDPAAAQDAATKNYVDTKDNALSDRITTAQNTANTAASTASAAMPKAGGTFTGAIAMSNKKITGLAAPSDGTDAANKTYVDEAVAAGIKANDAMTFKGTLGGSGATITTLPATAQKGDTYKVAAKGTYAGVAAKVGDLFINTADDDATATWAHVSSGYEDDYLQKFAVNGNVIHLTDGVTNTASGSVGSFTVVGDSNSNLQFEVSSNGNNHTITASMVWGTF